MNHTAHYPVVDSTTFRVNACFYHLTYSYGNWTLRKIINGKPHTKSEITCKRDEAIFDYISKAERRTPEEVRMAYENATAVV